MSFKIQWCNGSGNDFHRRLPPVRRLKLSNFLVATVASRCGCQSRVWHYLTPTQHSELQDSTDVGKRLYPIRLVMKDSHPITPPLPSLPLTPISRRHSVRSGVNAASQQMSAIFVMFRLILGARANHIWAYRWTQNSNDNCKLKTTDKKSGHKSVSWILRMKSC